MTYDLHLFRPAPGMNATAAFERHLEEDDRLEAARSTTPLTDAVRRKLLILCAEIAGRDGNLQLDESPRHVGLVDRAGGDGVEIGFFSEDCGEVSIQDWADRCVGERVLERVWTALTVIRQRNGMQAFDPQRSAVLDLDRDHVVLLDSAKASLRAARGEPEPESCETTGKRPWWKLW